MTHTSTEKPSDQFMQLWQAYCDKKSECEDLRERIAELEAAQAGRLALSDQLPQGFLSDVLTAAGLVAHGKRCKALGTRIGEAVEAIWKTSIEQREAVNHGTTQEKQG